MKLLQRSLRLGLLPLVAFAIVQAQTSRPLDSNPTHYVEIGVYPDGMITYTYKDERPAPPTNSRRPSLGGSWPSVAPDGQYLKRTIGPWFDPSTKQTRIGAKWDYVTSEGAKAAFANFSRIQKLILAGRPEEAKKLGDLWFAVLQPRGDTGDGVMQKVMYYTNRYRIVHRTKEGAIAASSFSCDNRTPR